MPHDLIKLADATEGLLGLFEDGGNMFGRLLPTKHAARFKAFCTEAQAIIGDKLGGGTPFSLNIGMAAVRLRDGPSYSDVEEASEQMRAAARMIERKLVAQPLAVGKLPYVALSRIAALQALKGGTFDFVRLVELCREINVTSAQNCHMATAMLLRAILDHVPPVFGFQTFAEVASQYGSRSFKGPAETLQKTSRKIADMHLHTPIRGKEDVPTAVQVTFSADLDVLLGEVIRLSKPAGQ